jgi:hypothetical protein
MTERLRLPKSPDTVRAHKAARQKRWRDGKRRREAVAANMEHAMGLGDGTPPPPLPPMSQDDLAKLMHDRMLAIVAGMDDERLLNKDYAPSINLGLKARGILDAREKAKSKTGTAELAFAIIAMLSGQQPTLVIDDGRTIEGDFEEVEEDE